MRRHRHPQRDRPRAGRPGSGARARRGRARALGGAAGGGDVQADAARPRQAPQVQPRDALGQAAEEDPRHHPLRRGGRRLRGRDQDARPPLSGNRVRGRARGRGAVHGAPGLPRLSGLAAPRGDAVGQDRGPVHRRRRALSHSISATVLRDAHADRAGDGDRAPRAEGDPRAPGLSLPGRPRLPDARSPGGHAVGRRGAAHPPGHPDRIEPGRRALYPGRAVDRAAPARQWPPPRHAQAPARPRQHGARRRARRGDDPRRRLRRGPRAGRGRAGRAPGGGGHARRGDGQSRLAHRPVSLRRCRRSRRRRRGGRPTARR